MVSESEKMMAQAAEDLFYRLSQGPFEGVDVGLLHGQMKAKDKEEVMEKFRRGEFSTLVSTTVIEVGVDVPNASVMVIEDANRFGLSQLHQLRGRVGRGAVQSYCILIADGQGEDSRTRMKAMVDTNDGFQIAEIDLRLRGPGMLAGTQQSGNADFKVADLVLDGKMLEVARQAAIKVVESDPVLSGREWQPVLANVRAAHAEAAIITVS
jgi:ATP-dependent DNA helicase RecG